MKRKKPVALTEQELDEALGASPLLRLKSRLSRNEAALTHKEISTPFAALDAIEALFSALQKGYSPEQLSAVFPEAWGKKTVAVPVPVVATLAFGWSKYRQAPAGTTLGECFKIEAVGGQGKVPTRKTIETRRRAFGYAYAVLKDYALAIAQGTQSHWRARHLQSVKRAAYPLRQ